MGLFTKLFGKSPRISVLEVFATYPRRKLSVAETRIESGISKRESYLLLRMLEREGLIVKTSKKGDIESYKLNDNDLRSRMLSWLIPIINLGELEAQMKFQDGIPNSELLPESFLNPFNPTVIARPQPHLILSSYPKIKEEVKFREAAFPRSITINNRSVPNLQIVTISKPRGGTEWKRVITSSVASPAASA